MENVKIYEIKQSAHDNFLVLRLLPGNQFFWNDAKFINNQVGDYVFVVNKTGKEALFARLAEKDINATYHADDNTSRFYYNHPYSVRGKWERFVRFDILESKTLPDDWAWTRIIGTSETYDLWKKDGELVGQVGRLEKVADLEKIFNGDLAREVLEHTTEQLRGATTLLPEIVDTIQTAGIQHLIAKEEFEHQLAKDKLDELLRFQTAPGKEDLYQRLMEQASKKEVPFLTFLASFRADSDEYRLLRIIGELIAYCDAKAAGKHEFNQYPDKRTIAHSFVRQPVWVLNLLRYKERGNDLNAISSPSIQNAISYLQDPLTGLTMLSDDHREMVARYLYRTPYDRLSFLQDTFRFFGPYGIRSSNPLNLTKIISDILYSKEVKAQWFEKVEGLVVADNTGWLEGAVETMKTHKKIVLWWNRLPSGGAEVQRRLRDQLDERSFFYIYYTRNGAAYCRSRIIDFALEKDYPEKKWNAGMDVESHEDDFDQYIDDDGKKARIVFLATEVIALEPPIPYDEFEFYQDYARPTQNNMQPFAEVNDDTAPIPLSEEVAEADSATMTLANMTNVLASDNEFRQILMAGKTKPFVLLAGISGIGKSRLARELAYRTCAIAELQQARLPGNFLLIPVKPNWNDSTGLLGYASAITNLYKITPFMQFLVRAWRYPQIPFFLCMDEMNLAPVELYMAEYLSAIESRRYGNGSWTTDYLIPAEVFANFSTDAFWNELGIPRDKKLQDDLIKNGLSIPPNLVIIGTVNMDETTHSFSRKVLDRAMTIEMNEVDLRKNLQSNSADLDYKEPFYSKELVCGVHTSAGDVFTGFDDGEQVLGLLIEINEVLDKTPFKIAYRVRNESLVYCYYHSLIKQDGEENWLTTAMDEIVYMKILSRIEGDETKCRAPLDGLAELFSDHGLEKCIAKVQEMLHRLKFGYTSFFP